MIVARSLLIFFKHYLKKEYRNNYKELRFDSVFLDSCICIDKSSRQFSVRVASWLFLRIEYAGEKIFIFLSNGRKKRIIHYSVNGAVFF